MLERLRGVRWVLPQRKQHEQRPWRQETPQCWGIGAILSCWRVSREARIGRKRDWRRIGILEDNVCVRKHNCMTGAIKELSVEKCQAWAYILE